MILQTNVSDVSQSDHCMIIAIHAELIIQSLSCQSDRDTSTLGQRVISIYPHDIPQLIAKESYQTQGMQFKPYLPIL